MALFSCASSRSKCMRYLRLRCQKLSFCFEHTHFVDLLVILGKRAQPLNIYNRGTMAKLIEACVPFCVCVCAHAYVWEPPAPLFPASHRKGLFGFIVQEGLCTQLAHLYKFSLYGVLWNGCTRSLHCMTLPCVHTTWLFNPALVCLHGQVHAYIRACRWLDWAVSVGLSIVMKKRIHHCFNVMSL